MDLGSNVSPLPRICPSFGACYLGVESVESLRTAAMRDFFGYAVDMILDEDRNFAEWFAGMLVCVIFFGFC
jgi:hypothetical protein